MSARELADQNNRLIVEDLVALGLSYDLFTRTTAGNHYRVVQDMFATVRDNGYMIEQVTRAAISPSTGRTLPTATSRAPARSVVPRGARGRPVRQLRQPNGPDRAHQPALAHQR